MDDFYDAIGARQGALFSHYRFTLLKKIGAAYFAGEYTATASGGTIIIAATRCMIAQAIIIALPDICLCRLWYVSL